jgi:subtilisin family serine protease
MKIYKLITLQTTSKIFISLTTIAALFFGAEIFADEWVFAEPQKAQVRYVPGEVLVKFKESSPGTTPAIVVESFGHEKLKELNRRVVQVKLKSGQSVEAAIAAYQSDPNVAHVQPNYLYKLSTIPNDTLYGELWGLKNNEQTVTDGPYPINNPGIIGMDMGLEATWDQITDCSSVIVAVLDLGINYTHTDLVANMWDGGTSYPNHGWDFFDDDNDPMPTDGAFHGTHLAGTIGAVGNNARGATGVCWNAELMALRAGDDNALTTASIFQGVDFALTNGARVINMSFGTDVFDQLIYDAISDAQNSGILVVTSAGNKNYDNDSIPHYPSNFDLDNIIAVAAVDQAYELATFSNYGSTTVDVGAPGVNIWSAVAGQTYSDNFSSGWTMTGGWAYDQCYFEHGLYDMLVNPSDWCTDGQYANDADDRAYKQFDLSGLIGAGVGHWALIDTEETHDFFRVAYKIGGGDPFVDGVLLFDESVSTLNEPMEFDHDLSECLTTTCSFGFQLESNVSITDLGVGILVFELKTAELNSNSYKPICGTSCAAPHVAGLAAMIWAYNPDYIYLDVVASIKNGGDAVAALAGITTTGKAVDAMGSLRYINPPTGVTVSIQ